MSIRSSIWGSLCLEMVTGIVAKSLLPSVRLLHYITYFVSLKLEIPISQKCKLFDSLVGSVLKFGSEIWGMHDATDVERIHTTFLRYVLGVKKSTNLAALYGELGRVPLSIFRKVIMLKYWIKILKQPDSSLVKLTYFMLKEDADANISYNGKNWSYQIKQILQTHGFEYIWNNQSEVEIPF